MEVVRRFMCGTWRCGQKMLEGRNDAPSQSHSCTGKASALLESRAQKKGCGRTDSCVLGFFHNMRMHVYCHSHIRP